MKTTKYYIMMITMMASTLLISCGSDDDDNGSNGTDPSDSTEQNDGLPTGWYSSGALEYVTTRHIQEFLNAGDYWGLEKENWANYWDGVTAIHVINGSTFESVVGGASLTRPSDYFSSKSFSGGGHSYTLYWYFNYPLDTYTSRPSGKWYNQNGYETNAPKYANGVITWGKNTYTKMNYTPKKW